MVLTHTPLLALLEEWALRVQLPSTTILLEAVVDDICLDLSAFCIVKPINDMRVATFDVIFVLEELPGGDNITFLCGRFVVSLVSYYIIVNYCIITRKLYYYIITLLRIIICQSPPEVFPAGLSRHFHYPPHSVRAMSHTASWILSPGLA